MGLTGQQIAGIIQSHKQRGDRDRKRWAKYRAWYQGNFFGMSEELPSGAAGLDGDDEAKFETNYAYSFVDTMIANVCPLNPQVSITARRQDLEGMAKGREALANDTLKRCETHEKLWIAATHASIYQRGFLKVTWDPRRRRPKIRNLDPRFVFFDLAAETWEDIRYIIEVTVVTKQEFNKRLKKRGVGGFYNKEVAEKASFAAYPAWLRDEQTKRSMLNEASKDVFQWVVIYEVYDFTDEEGVFYHFLEDWPEPLFKDELPYKHVKNPFKMLTFNENLDDIGGLSDIKLIEAAQEQLNELDTLELNHAKASIPATVFNDAAMDDPAAFKDAYMQSGQPGTFFGVTLREGVSIRDAIAPTPTANLSPSFNLMRERAIETITFTLGIPEYSRGQIGGTDVATEVALADTATRTRNGRRQQRIYDMVGWLGEAIIGLYDEFMDNVSVLYVRLTGKQELLQVTRQSLGLSDLKEDLGEAPLDYDYEAVPFSSVENNKLVQLRNIQSSWNALMWGVETKTVDQKLLMAKLLDLLMIPNVAPSPADVARQQAEAMAAAQAPPMGGLPQMAEPSPDRIATGALPAGMEPAAIPKLGGGAGQGTVAPTPMIKGKAGVPDQGV